MGKETKIGLAVVGVLFVVFGALLAKRFMSPVTVADDPKATESRDQVLAHDGAPEPTVVTVEQQTPAAAIARAARVWEAGPGQADPAGAELPRRGYMPHQVAPATPDVPDRYTRDALDDANGAGDSAAPADPFQGNPTTAPAPNDGESDAAPRPLEVDPRDASSLETSEPPVRSARNPLRRMSAAVPDGGDETADAISTVGVAPEMNDAEQAIPAVDPLEQVEEPATSGDRYAPAASPEPSDALSREWERDVPEPAGIAPVEPRQPRYQPRDTGAMPAEPAGIATGAPLPLADGMYTIQPSDNLWTISQKVYGTGGYFKAIYEHNRTRFPRADQLTVGAQIAVPPINLLEENYPELCPKQRRSALVQPRAVPAAAQLAASGGDDMYVVEEGDTLFDIARYELGKASRWGEIYNLNRDVLGEDFDYLQPGTELRMPAKRNPARDAISRQGDAHDRYQR